MSCEVGTFASFANEKTASREVKWIFQGPVVERCQSWDPMVFSAYHDASSISFLQDGLWPVPRPSAHLLNLEPFPYPNAEPNWGRSIHRQDRSSLWQMPRHIHLLLVVHLPSHVQLFETPWTETPQALLSFTVSQNLLKCMSIEWVMLSNYLILCHSLLLLLSIFLSIRVFSNELALRIRWPKYWSFSISPSNEMFRFDFL